MDAGRTRHRWATALAVAAACLAAGAPSAPAAAAESRQADRWLMVSDVHFTPFAGATGALVGRLQRAPVRRWNAILAATGHKPSTYGADTNAALLESSLAAMRRATPAPPVVVVSGDLLGHDFHQTYRQLAPHPTRRSYEAFVDKTVAFLAARFDTAFPHAQFVLTLGNNDSYCGDYEATPHSRFLLRAARAWEPLVDRHGRAPRFVASFRRLGSYVARLPRPGLHVVSVDDVFWSAHYDNACGSPAQRPGAAQARWLAAAMRRLPAGDRAWVVTHVPPGVDVYATSQGSGAPVPLLSAPGQVALLGALGPRRVPALVFGHLHMSTYRLGRRTPMLGVPSISPLFGNDPAFVVATVGRRGTIADYEVHALALGRRRPAWHREYDFGAAYGLPAFDAPSLTELGTRLAKDARLRRAYGRRYVSGGRYPLTAAQYPAYACGSTALELRAFTACRSALTSRSRSSAASAGRRSAGSSPSSGR